MICGVDEAGKGAVLGPMVIAAVGADTESVLDGLPVRDSKLLSPARRENLFELIADRCRVAIVIVPVDRIDSRGVSGMNGCIARAHAAAIMQIFPETAYVDACDVNEGRYAQMVLAHLDIPCRVISEHKADITYRIVSAASIVAKVVRDREVALLAEEFGIIGSGYPSDPETIAFLSSYIEKHCRPPSCARKSWKTVSSMMEGLSQSRLF
ncbi:MAG: Ribonuclease HII [Methanoregula sp. PtaU1.Bin051]|nr:MAG: Ribonuclease HII [Methanoregula sp. PtaU1.Bin051]